MKQRRLYFLLAGLFVVVFGITVAFSGGGDEALPAAGLELKLELAAITNVDTEGTPMVGESSPDFAFTDANGNERRLSDFRGERVLLNFWASWCPPCRQEMPDMQAVHDRYGDSATILAVNIQEDPKTVGSFMEDNELTFTAVLDSDARLAQRYLVRSIPTTFFIDEQGIIQTRYVGPLTEAAMTEFITAESSL